MRPEPRLERWRFIINALGIDLDLPVSRLSATDIKETSGEEPRLMAKIDRREELPTVFAQAPAFLLPLSNGEYAVIRGDGYHDLEPVAGETQPFVSRLEFPLTSALAGASETQHIDFAFNSGLVERFAGVGNLYLTIRGRKRAPEFDFHVGDLPLRAAGVQVEIDAGFEGKHHIVVLEGKMGAPDNFHIRQLYYPFRFWQTLVPEKTVIPVFFTYRPELGLSTFWQYRFRDPLDYLSIELVRAESFAIQRAAANVLQPRPIVTADGPRLSSNVIPQADDVRKISEFPFRVAEGATTSAMVAEAFGFNERQSRYYREAAEALGLVVLADGRYHLTEAGAEFVTLPVQQRNEFLFRQMCRLPVFFELLIELFLDPDKSLSKAAITEVIGRVSSLTGATLVRRADTLFSWLRWVELAIGLVHVDKTNVRIAAMRLV